MKNMKKDLLKAARKQPYTTPALLKFCIEPSQMLAASGDPQVHTTNEKASTDHEALSKENQGYDVWDDDWRQ